ncbi:GAF domain protein [Oceanicola granulosus HTCC2516]|uniref:GAF domain protein n=1 Tax=Oceanicola granulosus (strain ATCC BAA-861 / DSM 15982 / KCTC 12143 / HTCC2516) TaxID=314256 RepID=Q2CJQ2_OCEGH|nr:hypothetical protein [Oceanicola granulosus]EAR53087.1 GAF domain protein [Oceanicola granulosus HTCC2516]
MLSAPTAILRRAPDGAETVLLGADKAVRLREAYAQMAQDKPSARRAGEELVVAAPAGEAVYLFLIPAIPPMAALSDGIRHLQQLAQGIEDGRGGGGDGPGAAEMQQALAVDLNRIGARRAVPRLRVMLNALTGHRAAATASAIRLRGGRAGRIVHHDRRHSRLDQEIRNLVRRCTAAGVTHAAHPAPEGQDSGIGLQCELLADRLEVASLEMHLPEGDGIALLLGDPDRRRLDASLPALVQAMTGPLRGGGKGVRWRRLVLPVLIAALLLAALVPLPVRLPATGQTIAREAEIVALLSDAFLETVLVAPGDEVAEGDPIARFNAPQLLADLSEAQLQVKVEAVNAQDALAENDYAGFQSAEQRGLIAEARVANLEDQIAALTPTAPVAGRVVQALPRGASGQFYPLGEPVATIQQVPAFDLMLAPSELDAPALEPGQSGEVYFRGLADATFPIRLASAAVPVPGQQEGEVAPMVRAEITGGPQERLITGLTGYARIEAGRAPAGVVALRYAVEWLRLRTWTLFGWRI